MRKNVIVEECHKKIMEKTKQVYAFDESKDLATWKKELKQKFIELSGISDIEKNTCPLNFEIEEEVQMEGYKRIRFTIESEIGAIVPCYVLIPDGKAEKLPVVITLQGHSSGFHNSIGEVKLAEDITQEELERVILSRVISSASLTVSELIPISLQPLALLAT